MRLKKRIKEFTEDEIVDKLGLEKPCYITSVTLNVRYLAGDSEHRSFIVEYLVVKEDGREEEA